MEKDGKTNNDKAKEDVPLVKWARRCKMFFYFVGIAGILIAIFMPPRLEMEMKERETTEQIKQLAIEERTLHQKEREQLHGERLARDAAQAKQRGCENELAQIREETRLKAKDDQIKQLSNDLRLHQKLEQERLKVEEKDEEIKRLSKELRLINEQKARELAEAKQQENAQNTRWSNCTNKLRVVVDSLIEDIDKPTFLKLAKKLKKEKVNVDFMVFGTATAEDSQTLAKFVGTLNGNANTSSLLIVSEGSDLIEALVSSAICQGEGGNMTMIEANGGVEFGIDAEEDPELALALRVSLEEQRQRQRQETENESNNAAQQPMDAQPTENNGLPAVQENSANEGGEPSGEVDVAAMTEEEQLDGGTGACKRIDYRKLLQKMVGKKDANNKEKTGPPSGEEKK